MQTVSKLNRKNRDSQPSTRGAPDIDDGNPRRTKKASNLVHDRPLQGSMIDMQARIKLKEAKRKVEEAQEDANKRRCEREERRAENQLRAYWETFPLPNVASVPADGSGDGSQDPDSSSRHMPRHKCLGPTSSCDRRNLLSSLRTSIAERAEPDLKRPKLDPQNSREGEDPVAINRDVDSATKDQSHTRIHKWELRGSIKRACTFDELSRSCKASKSELRSILNICDSGKSG